MRNKKIIIILSGITVIIVTVILGIFLYVKSSVKTDMTVSVSPTPGIPEELILWNDQSGFSFQYPKSLELNPHEEDKENYANLELTSATHSGSLIIWAKDTTAEDIDDWIKKEKINGEIDSTLGGESAKKIIKGEEIKKVIIATIYNGYLYEIEANLNTPVYWNQVFSKVTSTFRFIEPQKSRSKNNIPVQEDTSESTYDDPTISGDEEVIE